MKRNTKVICLNTNDLLSKDDCMYWGIYNS